jgi:hypothetical protein
MPIKTIKAPGYPDFKISHSPLDVAREVGVALEEVTEADQLAEFAGMRLYEACSASEGRNGKSTLTSHLETLGEKLSQVREILGDCHYLLEKIAGEM